MTEKQLTIAVSKNNPTMPIVIYPLTKSQVLRVKEILYLVIGWFRQNEGSLQAQYKSQTINGIATTAIKQNMQKNIAEPLAYPYINQLINKITLILYLKECIIYWIIQYQMSRMSQFDACLVLKRKNMEQKKVLNNAKISMLPQQYEFFPVLGNKKLNPIKIKQIYLLKQKQRRRQTYQLLNLIRRQYQLPAISEINIRPKPRSEKVKMNNSSFSNLHDRMRQSSRYASLNFNQSIN